MTERTTTVAILTADRYSSRALRRFSGRAGMLLMSRKAYDCYRRSPAVLLDTIVECLEDYEHIVSVQQTYESIVRVSRARLPNGQRLTSLVRTHGFELWWLNNKTVYTFYLTPYLTYGELWEKLRFVSAVIVSGSFRYEDLLRDVLRLSGVPIRYVGRRAFHRRTIRALVSIRKLLVSFVQLNITIASALVLAVRRCPRLGLWVGDRVTPPYDYDFRYEDVYRSLRQQQLPFVEFLRSYNTVREFLRNVWIRRRPVLYYESLARPFWLAFVLYGRLVEWYWRRKVVRWPGASFEMKILLLVGLKVLPDCYAQRVAIPACRILLRVIGVRALLTPGGYSRNGPLIMASKLEGILTFALQHGPYVRSYHPDETGAAFDGPRSHAVDVFGVWSEHWKQYYLQEQTFFRHCKFVIGVNLRAFFAQPSVSVRRGQPGRIYVLLISEPLVAASEILPYLEAVLADSRFELLIKCRPDRNDNIVRALGDRAKNLRLFSGRIDEAFHQADVVLGSHSTALLEALLFYKPVVVFMTKRWGDYFGVDRNRIGIITDQPEAIGQAILNACAMPVETREQARRLIWGESRSINPSSVIAYLEEVLR